MNSSTRWLVVLLEGVATADLRSGATPRLAEQLSGDAALPNLRWPSGGACIDRWLELLDAQHLRQLGLQVDLRSLLLNPAWRSDDSSIRQLGQRPSGPADLTCLRLRDQARSAMQLGLGSLARLDSLKRMAGLLGEAENILSGDGIDLRTLVVTYAPLVPAHRSFDAAAYLLQALGRRQRRDLEIRQSPAALQLRASTSEAIEAAEGILLRGPAASQLQLLSHAEAKANGIRTRPCEEVYIPRSGIALHHSPLLATPSLISTRGRNACALPPWDSCSGQEIKVAELVKELLAQLQQPELQSLVECEGSRDAVDPIASYPDLECLFAAEPVSV